jgi:hypothetical protein
VRFGPPRCFAAVPGEGLRPARQRTTDRIMADIAALLA